MTTDPIMKEVHRVKDELARKFDNDPEKYYQHLLQRQEANKAKGVKYASLPPKRPKKDEAAWFFSKPDSGNGCNIGRGYMC